MPSPARDTAAGRIYNDLRNLARRRRGEPHLESHRQSLAGYIAAAQSMALGLARRFSWFVESTPNP